MNELLILQIVSYKNKVDETPNQRSDKLVIF